MGRILVPSGFTPRPWNVSPGLVAPEWRWAWRGLRFAAPLWEGGGPPFDPISRTLATLHGSPTWEEGANGYGLTCNADSEVVSFDLPFTLGGPGGSFTVIVVARTDGNLFERQRVVKLADSGGATQFWVDFHGANSGDPLTTGIQDVNNIFSGTAMTLISPYELGRTYTIGSTLVLGSQLRGYLDGEFMGDTDQSTQTESLITDLHIGNSAQSTLAQNGPTFACYMWNRVLTDREHALIARDPFGPFRMERRVALLSTDVGVTGPTGKARIEFNF